MMEAVRTSETSADNYFTRQYIPEDNSEVHELRMLINLQKMKIKKKRPLCEKPKILTWRAVET
jgi:hypothetical protein